MDYLLIFALIFVAGTLILLKTNAERYLLIIFMIRTKYGLELLDKAAQLSPRLWRFIADFAVVFSFGGLGAWYVSKHRRIEPILSVIYLPAALAYLLSDGLSFSSVILTIILFIMVIITAARRNVIASNSAFAFGFIAFFLLALKFIPALSGMGSGNTMVVAPQIASIILLIFIGVIGLPALLIGGLVFQGLLIVTGQSNVAGVSPILPSEKDGQIGLSPPGEGYDFFFIPIQYALIAFAVLLLVHEFAHGVLSRVENIKVKSAGLLTFGPFPIGGFVEPDEEELKKEGGIKNMRISAMGSFANFTTAFVFIILLNLTALLLVVFTSNGIISFDGVIENGSVIQEVNGIKITTLESFREVMSEVKPNENVTLKTDKGSFVLETAENPDSPGKSHLGVYMGGVPHTKNPMLAGAFYTLIQLFNWIFLLNVMIGLVNLLPIVPFDGGRMFNEIVHSFKMNAELEKKIVYVMFILGLFILLANITPLITPYFDSLLRWITGSI